MTQMTEKELQNWVKDWREKIAAAWRAGLDEESDWLQRQYEAQLGQISVVHNTDSKEDKKA